MLHETCCTFPLSGHRTDPPTPVYLRGVRSMEDWSRETAGAWMVPRSRGMAAAVALGAALTAVYAVLAALALTAPNAITVPTFGAAVRADAGSFTALFRSSRPANHTHVLAAVASVPSPAIPVARSPAATTRVGQAPAPRHHGGHVAVSRHDHRWHRHEDRRLHLR